MTQYTEIPEARTRILVSIDYLERFYDSSNVRRKEDYRSECQGGFNYSKTINLAMEQTGDLEAIASIAAALYSIVDWPNAGTIAWEMRKFIRRTKNAAGIKRLGDLVAEIGRKAHGKVIGTRLMDADYLYFEWDGDYKSVHPEASKMLNVLERILSSIR